MWKHGRSAYVHHKCRCQLCREANAAYFSRYRSVYRRTAKYAAYQDAFIAAYRERNRDALSAYSMMYRRTHRDAVVARERSPRGRAQKRERESRRRALTLDQFIEDVDPFVLYRAWGGMCGICREYVREDTFHVDHRIPLAAGGMHGYVNCQPAHPSCNARKGARIAP